MIEDTVYDYCMCAVTTPRICNFCLAASNKKQLWAALREIDDIAILKESGVNVTEVITLLTLVLSWEAGLTRKYKDQSTSFYRSFMEKTSQNIEKRKRIERLEAILDGYQNFTWPNGESEDAAVAAARLQKENEVFRRRSRIRRWISG